jgi:hypothetical protein
MIKKKEYLDSIFTGYINKKNNELIKKNRIFNFQLLPIQNIRKSIVLSLFHNLF